MPYIVNTYNGQQITIVNDGTIDQTTDLKLIGKNYAGFGEILNENLVYLLENFAGATEPPNAVAGQVWFDSANKVLKFYDGNKFRIAGGAEIGANAPTGLAKGDMWWEEDGEQLYVYNGQDFILVGPVATGGEGVSQLSAITIKDTLANDRTVLKVTIQDDVVALISKNEFTIDDSKNPIPGFSIVNKGFNLASEAVYPAIKYWGTARNSDQLGGIDASQYILDSGNQIFSDLVNFNNDTGILIGAGSDLHLYITNGDEVNITNEIGNVIKFGVNSGVGAQEVARFENATLIPASDNTGSLGTLTVKWRNIFAYDIALDDNGALDGNTIGLHTGDVTGNVTGNLTGDVTSGGNSTFNNVTVNGTITGSLVGTSTTAELVEVDGGAGRAAVTTATANTIAARDSNGDITANLFNGTSTDSQQLDGSPADITQTADTIAKRDTNGDLVARKFQGTATAAQFADLAEMYASDENYEPGTVLIFGGEAEVTTTDIFCDHRVAGIVSTDPAHLMNSTQEGVAVALRGRVPCKVEGPVQKGDLIVTSPKPGVATAIAKDSALPYPICVIGKAIQNNSDTGIKLVEVVV